jgi:hypothetical protein
MKQMIFASTSWRDIKWDHPGDWELFQMVWKDDRWRCSFTDRYHQRLDMRWRKLNYVPSLENMLQRHQEKAQKEKTVELEGQAEGWKGTLRQVEGGWVVNAGTFLEEAKILVEIILVWPGPRDQELENTILRSVRPLDTADGMKKWEAMGMKVYTDAEYDIIEYKAEAGRIEWVFGKTKKGGRRVAIEKLAMPRYWLKGSVAQWLRSQADEKKVIEEWTEKVNGHQAACLRSSAQGLMADSLLLKRRMKAEMAWLCETEQRVYRISCFAAQRKMDIEIPKDVKIECCKR